MSSKYDAINKVKDAMDSIALSMDQICGAIVAANHLLKELKKERYHKHTISTLESDIKKADKALDHLNDAYDLLSIKGWSGR